MQLQWVAAIDTCHRRGYLLFAHVLSLGLLVTCFCTMAWAQMLEVFEPPIVMHDDIEFQWGGHTFSYLLEGETGLALEKVAKGMAAPLELDVIVHDDGRFKDLEHLRPCHGTEARYEQPQRKYMRK